MTRESGVVAVGSIFRGNHLTELRTDLARFTFLLGHDDGEQPFGHNPRRPPPRPDMEWN